MYLSAIKTAIQNLEEKRFYSVALMYLEHIGYRELSVVDGPGDGGRDVICSREDLRIQLSVRKDWQNKINEESFATAEAGKHHLIFVTNRIISPKAEQDFLDSSYKQKGIVDLTIADLRRITTALARPGVIRRAYEMLGMAVPTELNAEPKDIAISTLLMFSTEARELRDEVVEANVRAQLLRSPGMTEVLLVDRISDALPGQNVDRAVRSALSRLRVAGRIQQEGAGLRLSEAEHKITQAAETEFLTARQADVRMLAGTTGLKESEAEELLDIALELLIRNRDLAGVGPIEESLRNFLAEHGLTRKRAPVFEALAKTSLARLKQHGETINQIFSTNSFDIYRALGRRTDVSIVLDASVAMPVLFGLTFGAAKSRYGVAALALKSASEAHGIKMVVPRAYLNEMASHGIGALEKLEVYNALPAEARGSLRASGNAYLSHYTHIADTLKRAGDNLGLKEFLDYFGVKVGRAVHYIENRIETLLDQHGIKVIPNGRYDQYIRNKLVEEKPNEPKIIVDHDAIVATMIKNDDKKGFVLATWDKAMIEFVEDIARVFADTPARVIDFLSIASGQDFESEQSYELLTTLLHMDERVAARLAQKVEQIRSVEQAYKLDQFILQARAREGESWTLTPENVAPFLDEENSAADKKEKDSPS